MQQRPDSPRSRLVLAVLTKYQVPEKKAVVFAALEGAWIKSLDALTALDPAAFDELADELKEEHQIPPRITKAILNEVQGRQPVLCAPSATEAQQLSPFDQRQEGSARRKKILAAPPATVQPALAGNR